MKEGFGQKYIYNNKEERYKRLNHTTERMEKYL